MPRMARRLGQKAIHWLLRMARQVLPEQKVSWALLARTAMLALPSQTAIHLRMA